MNIRIIILFVFISTLFNEGLLAQLPDCPSSPNCINTLSKKKRKRLPPLPFFKDLIQSKEQLKNLINSIDKASLNREEEEILSYIFVTGIGKFKDDVSFWFDETNMEIHFRSASRKGWHDMGANRRRMKKLSKRWNALF